MRGAVHGGRHTVPTYGRRTGGQRGRRSGQAKFLLARAAVLLVKVGLPVPGCCFARLLHTAEQAATAHGTYVAAAGAIHIIYGGDYLAAMRAAVMAACRSWRGARRPTSSIIITTPSSLLKVLEDAAFFAMVFACQALRGCFMPPAGIWRTGRTEIELGIEMGRSWLARSCLLPCANIHTCCRLVCSFRSRL